MFLPQWLQQLVQRWSLRGGKRRRRAGRVPARTHRRVRLCLEVLEGRVVPSTFMVTTEADSGPGSLRQAILDSNATPGGTNTIHFDFTSPTLPLYYPPGVIAIDTNNYPPPTFANGIAVIQPTSDLPPITNPVILDGSQSALTLTGDGAPGVEISGAGLDLQNGASGSEIKGLVINSANFGIVANDVNHVTINDCLLGVTFQGTNATANNTGLYLENGSSNNFISDCIIAHNVDFGVEAKGDSNSNTFEGNLIADNPDGIAFDNSSNNVLGNAAAGLGNTIVNNTNMGIVITWDDTVPGASTPQSNVIVNNDISDNDGAGIDVSNGIDTQIGGMNTGEGNIITGNGVGVTLEGYNANGNLVQGNSIGIFPDGTTKDSQGKSAGNDSAGVLILDSANNTVEANTISDTNPSKTADAILSTGTDSASFIPAAVVIASPNSEGNTVSDNRIGTDPTGTTAAPNYGEGIVIQDASGNTVQYNLVSASQSVIGIGGPSDGDGIYLGSDDSHIFATQNVLTDNQIGTDVTGTKALGNAQAGIVIQNAGGNTIGGTSGKGNLISGNGGPGIYIGGSSSSGPNEIQSNLIGTDTSGKKAVPNQKDGISIDGAANTVIGGDATTYQNVISGNGGADIDIFDDMTGTAGGVVQGNLIGTDISGKHALGNSSIGVLIGKGAAGVQIGGTRSPLGNLISGNTAGGVLVEDGATGVQIQGNYIGLDITGSSALGNGSASTTITDSAGNRIGGVDIENAAGNTIGGNAVDDRNFISGNTGPGIFVYGKQATQNVVQSNFIGTDTGAGIAIPNSGDGIEVVASNTTVGGIGAGNLVAGNQGNGITLADDSTNGISPSGNVVEGNDLGDAEFAVFNSGFGIALLDAPSNTIGGTAPGAGNTFDGNTLGDVDLKYSGTTGNTILGNTIGAAHHNPDQGDGIDIDNAPNNTIGGTAAGAGNLIRYHAGNGIFLTSANGTTIQGNTISANQSAGVFIVNSAQTLLGGSRSAGAGNTIGGNTVANGNTTGVLLAGSATHNTQILGNDIINNPNAGVGITSGASNNQIGGDSADQSNTISGSSNGPGVGIQNGTGNAILVNSISNDELGIDLGLDGVTPNDPGDADTGANGLQNYPVLLSAIVANGSTTIQGYLNTTPNTTATLRFFTSPSVSSASGYGEGQDFLGAQTVTTDAGGNATFTATFSTALAPGTVIAATASVADPAGGTDTSEFSKAIRMPAAEFQVNTFTAGDQYGGNESVGTDANGNFVVVWAGNGPQGKGIYYRRFDASGLPLDPVERLANVTQDTVVSPAIAVAPDGSFVIGWGAQASNPSASDLGDIYARRFAADGTPLDAAEFQVNTTHLQIPVGPQIAIDSKGNFVLTWETGNPYGQGNGYDISARRYQADGTPLDAQEFTVNQTLSGDQTSPSIAMNPKGDFVIGWYGQGQGLVARRFSGSTSSNEFALNSSSTPNSGPALALAADGRLLAAWGTIYGINGIYFRRFDAENNPLDAQEVSGISKGGTLPTVGFKSDDSFTIAWQAVDNTGAATNIMYRTYAADGTPLTDAAAVAQNLSSAQETPSLSVAPNDRNFVITWDSFGQDGDGLGVFARRFGPVNNPPNVYPLFGETGEGKPIQLTLSGDSGDPGVTQTLTYAVATNPSHGTLSNFDPATGTFTYTPVSGYIGQDSFTVTVTDDDSLGAPARTSDPATVSIIVLAPLPQPPAATPSKAPPPPVQPPALQTPPLLAFFDSLLRGSEEVMANGGETVIDSFFGVPLFVSIYDSSGKLVSVTLFGLDVTFLFA